MTFSVGVLYDTAEFLRFAQKIPIDARQFSKIFSTFRVASAERILKTAQQANWIHFTESGTVELTSRGVFIAASSPPEETLRYQLRDLILAVKPTWALLIPKGRAETEKYLNTDTKQCFHEAALMADTSADIIDWWDTLAKAARGLEEDTNLDTGRYGERLSFDYESQRTGHNPIWQSIESNLSGYDLLSRVDRNDQTALYIEVKTSKVPVSEAQMHLSKNEWDVACTTEYYRFHLWSLHPFPQVLVVSKEEMAHHIPKDMGHGKWKSAVIPFRIFPSSC